MTDTSYEPADHYDRVSEAWRLLLGDELHYGVFAGDEPLAEATQALTDRMVEAAQLTAGLEVLDVGCGNGTPACQLAERFGVKVLGITTSGVGVAAGTALAARSGLSDSVRFEERDGTDNGLPPESFDRVWVLESSHLMRERAALLSECARVLRPAGRVVLCDIIRHRDIPFEEVRARRDDFATLRQAFGDAHMEPLATYRAGFESHGLVVDREDDLTEATLLTFERWRDNARRNRDAVVDALGADEADAFVRSADILEGFWRDGTLGYGLISAVKPG